MNQKGTENMGDFMEEVRNLIHLSDLELFDKFMYFAQKLAL